ncbi:MAG: hypothetical protein LQ345_002252 [Seirophora villosa]|nr:MAG: hypothetical protein LQ345_002252 [Seirophora villosa]
MKWMPVSCFPTNVHLDLIHNNVISDPFVAKNEKDAQWVGEKSWIYKVAFKSPALMPEQNAVIAFEGLDTHATVLFNGTKVLRTNDMFVPNRVNVTKNLRDLVKNELEIVFESTYLIGKTLLEADQGHKYGCWNEVYSSRIEDLFFTTKVDESLKWAEISAKCEIEGSADEVRFEILLHGIPVTSETAKVVDGLASASLRPQKPELWFPARYGKQPLYELKAVLLLETQICDNISKRFGFRRAELIQRKLRDVPGTSFYFQINNIPVFSGGSNWIPADSFIPRIEPSRYRDWVELAVKGNQSMIRVWGGGIYEEQAFYDACDEMGVLVWQDFLFACGNYPAHDDFLDLVKREAMVNVKRLRHHPCIVAWAGNNEDYQYQESEHLDYDPQDRNPNHWLKSNFPARYIYEKILADVTQELMPNTYYHFGSPFGGKTTSDPTIGDIHQWNVWHGTQERYQDWDKLGGRFVAEFGMQACPSVKTIDSYLLEGECDPERFAQSSTIDFHNKAVGHERRLAAYMIENIPYSHSPLDYYVYCTQLMQAECLATAFRLWKRDWKGPGREQCGGALVWQLNDCWPAQSWSIVDYHLRPKLAHYAIRRELADITINMKRVVREIPADKYTRAHVKRVHRLQLFGTNLSLRSREYMFHVQAWDIITGKPSFFRILDDLVRLPCNQSTEIVEYDLGNDETEARTVVAAWLIDSEGGYVDARSVNWPEPLKYVHFQQPRDLYPDIFKLEGGRTFIAIEERQVPVKGIALEVNDQNGDAVVFEDNCIDLVPGEALQIAVKGLAVGEEERITVRYLKAGIDL